MSDTQPYSEATRAYVETKIRMLCGDGKVPDGAEIAARVVLRGLARRGLLLPEGAETQWSVRYPDGFVESPRFTRAGAEQHALELNGEVVWRPVGPWSPVPPKESPDA